MAIRLVIALGAVAILVGLIFWYAGGHVQESNISASNSDIHSDAGLDIESHAPELASEYYDDLILAQLSAANEKTDEELALERISPETQRQTRTESSTAIELGRGDIGFVDAEGVQKGELGSVRELILKLSTLTDAHQQLDIELVELRPDTDGQKLIYRQLINGIPTKFRSSIVFDESGHVTSMSSHLVDPTFAEAGPQVLEEEAISHALDALMRKSGRDLNDAAVRRSPSDQPRLYYGYSGDNSRPQLFWRMSVGSRSHGLDYSAVVNATTGETLLSPNVEDINSRVCEQADAEEPDCNDDPPNNPNRIWEEDSNGDEVCVGTYEECYEDGSERAWTPWLVLNRLEDLMESGQGDPPNCCDGVGKDGVLDVMIDETNTDAYDSEGNPYPRSSPGYSKTYGTIIVPPTSQTAASGNWKSGVDFATDQEVLAHEGAHAIICSLNPAFCENSEDPDEKFEQRAMREGIADAVAGLYSETYGLPGEDWVMLDETAANSSMERDITEDTDFTEDGKKTDDSYHRHGMVYAHAIYKMRQQGASIADLTAIIVHAIQNIKQDHGVDPFKYDYQDFAKALENAAKSISSEAEDIAEDVVDEMTELPDFAGSMIEHGSCSGAVETFNVTWWQGATGGHVDTYEVKYKVGSVWYDWFEGGMYCTPHSASGTVYFKVKTHNRGGSSDWKNMQQTNYCGGGGQPF